MLEETASIMARPAWMLAEFPSSDALIEAVRTLRRQGYSDLDAYSPYPIDGMSEALGLRRSPVPLFVLGGGLLGAGLAYFMQWWMATVDYPLNIGGRPAHSPPPFIPITFELAVLLAALSAFFGVFAWIGLPRLHHPVFSVEGFANVTVDGFWVGVGTEPAREQELRQTLLGLGSIRLESPEVSP